MRRTLLTALAAILVAFVVYACVLWGIVWLRQAGGEVVNDERGTPESTEE